MGIFAAPLAAEVVRTESETAREQADWGAYYWQKGEIHQAIAAWSEEAKIYHLQGLTDKEAETILKISTGYISLGQLSLAIFQLEKLLSTLKQPSLLARTWEQLGIAHSRSSAFDEAVSAYKKSLEIERNLSTLNNLTILLQKQNLHSLLQANSSREGDETERYRHQAQLFKAEALEYAQLALAKSESEESSSSVRALIEWGKLSKKGLSEEQLKRGRKLLAVLLPSRTKVFLVINWAKLDSKQTKYWLSQAQKIAQTIGDARAESYALLELGFLYERLGDLEQSLKYAQDAQLKAQSKLAFDSLYRAQWLAGRIYQEWGNRNKALGNYRNALASLDAFNQGFTTISVERRIDFNTEIEPIYREMLKLLLDRANPSEAIFNEVLAVAGKLRLAQLQNYFGDNCFEIDTSSSSQELLADQNAVSLTSIILDDQTHFILQLPDGTVSHRQAELGKAEITKIANNWYERIKEVYSLEDYSPRQDLYNLIVRPFEAEIGKFNPSTLIFIHDGVLRNLPMAALFDGEKFLAQKWASVSSLGLKFKSTTISQDKSAALAFGLSVAREGWSELEDVPEEVDYVVQMLGGHKFLDRDFTANNLALKLNRGEYSVLHLATHGYFGGVAENSFLLAYDRSLSVLDLEKDLSQSRLPINLLVLSACETSISSDSTLGLTGVALRSGIDSVLGSLWQVQDDEQLELINAFYSHLQHPNWRLATALQQVQIEQIQDRATPSKWAAINLFINF